MRQFWITAAIVFGLDQVTKLAVVHGLDLINRGSIDVLPRWGLITVALGISAWVVWWMRSERGNWKGQVSGGLLVGGAIGNVIDRIFYGAVADFLNMSCCGIENPYVFNVADIAIFIGAVGLIFFAGNDKGPARRKG